jgi:phospholipid-transporting ATPase
VASYNNNSNQSNPFEDSSESGLGQSRYEYSNTQPEQQGHSHQNRDLIDLQQNQPQTNTFSNSTSSSTLQQPDVLATPAYIHQGSHQQQLKRGDSSFAIDEGKINRRVG